MSHIYIIIFFAALSAYCSLLLFSCNILRTLIVYFYLPIICKLLGSYTTNTNEFRPCGVSVFSFFYDAMSGKDPIAYSNCVYSILCLPVLMTVKRAHCNSISLCGLYMVSDKLTIKFIARLKMISRNIRCHFRLPASTFIEG